MTVAVDNSRPTHGHTHDHHHGHDRDHEHEQLAGPDEDHPLWRSDHLHLVSVGIDIGSATTQFVMSRLDLHRRSRELTTRYEVVGRTILHQSAVHLTPYTTDDRLDNGAIERLLADAFIAADITADDIDTGAVILTGEAMRRDNAETVARAIARTGGSFLCATAGHQFEATLAAHGSGGVELSRRTGGRVLTIDIGGGTTKFAVIENGAIAATSAIHIGARLVAWNSDRLLDRVEPDVVRVAEACGTRVVIGTELLASAQMAMAAVMAECVVAAARGDDLPVEVALTAALPSVTYDAIIFSGGVSRYMSGNEQFEVGDLGRTLAAELLRRVDALPGPVVASGRHDATVLGAAHHSVSISGNTIFITNKELLPLRGLRVASLPPVGSGDIDADALARAVAVALESGAGAFALRWKGPPSYRRITTAAAGLLAGLRARIRADEQRGEPSRAGEPLIVLVDADIARTLGTVLVEEHRLDRPLVCLDGMDLDEFDVLDIGAVFEHSGTVPIMITSMLFDM